MIEWKWWKRSGKSNWNYSAENGWYDREEEDYGWVKRTLATILIFTVIYTAHVSDTSVGQNIDDGVRYMLTKEMDFAKLNEFAATIGQENMDTSVFKYIQAKLARPASPLMYMVRPMEGTIINNPLYTPGWMIKTAPGENVRASAQGKVKAITDSVQHGKILIIEHGQGIETVYGRLNEIIVLRGDSVSQGQIIARVAKNDKDGSMLYFELRENGQPVDPSTRIKGSFLKEGK